MAGINGIGNVNKVNLSGVNQAGAAKNAQQAKNETENLKLDDNQLDGFVRSNNDVQEAKKDDEPKQGGDGAKKGKGNGKSWKDNYLSRVAEKLKWKQDQPFNPNPNAGSGTFDWIDAAACAVGACGDTWGWW